VPFVKEREEEIGKGGKERGRERRRDEDKGRHVNIWGENSRREGGREGDCEDDGTINACTLYLFPYHETNCLPEQERRGRKKEEEEEEEKGDNKGGDRLEEKRKENTRVKKGEGGKGESKNTENHHHHLMRSRRRK